VSSAWDRVADTFSSQFPEVTDLMNQAKADVLVFSAFPFEHWRKIWSTNPLERVTKERSSAGPMSWVFSPMTMPLSAS
jgi:putative transposase